MPALKTSDCALVMTVLKTYSLQILFTGLCGFPSLSVGSDVLRKTAENSSPVKTNKKGNYKLNRLFPISQIESNQHLHLVYCRLAVHVLLLGIAV